MIDHHLTDRVLPKVLRDAADAQPEVPFIFFGKDIYSYAEIELRSSQFAHGLRRWGVKRGSRVALIMDNCPEFIISWFALAKIGAITVPINTSMRGPLLRYYTVDSDCTHIVVHAHYLGALVEARKGDPAVPTAVLPSDLAIAHGAGPGWHDLFSDGEALREQSLDVELNVWDPWLIVYTSGTTGPSKGSVCPFGHSISIGRTQAQRLALTPDDRMYTCFPLYHGNALNYSTLTALWGRSAIVLAPRFSASRFWSDINQYRVSIFYSNGAITRWLENLPVTPEEASNPARISVIVPNPVNRRELEVRWGVKILSQYGMSEASQIAYLGDEGYDKPRTAGRISPTLDVRIVNENDIELPRCKTGEVILRAKEPWTHLIEYYGKPEATAKAFRNLWFHTGDRGYIDEDGFFFFVDRVKTSIKRRGENVSAFEVEAALQRHPGIAEAAAIPIPYQPGDDEVGIFVVRSDQNLTEREVIEFAVDNMAYFMVPRYVHFVDELPKTATAKVRKGELIDFVKQSPQVMWDREAAGIEVNRFTASKRAATTGKKSESV
jgi:crotonobetaine/carnitine-CoA ligase